MDCPGTRQVKVFYRRHDSRIALCLTVIVANEDGWRERARTTAHIIGELHFHLYDLEGDHDGR